MHELASINFIFIRRVYMEIVIAKESSEINLSENSEVTY